MLNKEIYNFMEAQAFWLSWWVLAFTFINLYKIFNRFVRKIPAASQHTLYVEAAGLPLVLLHSVCFVKALIALDFISALLFAWWGPGFLWVAILYLRKMKKGQHMKWGNSRKIISWICKINYLIFVAIYWKYECYTIIYVFSIWIINDQLMLAWLSNDGDRFRRTFHDFWFFRLCYPAGLFLPFLFPASFQNSAICSIYGLSLFVTWLSGIFYLFKIGKFMQLPQERGLLRNMTYFKEAEN